MEMILEEVTERERERSTASAPSHQLFVAGLIHRMGGSLLEVAHFSEDEKVPLNPKTRTRTISPH